MITKSTRLSLIVMIIHVTLAIIITITKIVMTIGIILKIMIIPSPLLIAITLTKMITIIQGQANS